MARSTRASSPGSGGANEAAPVSVRFDYFSDFVDQLSASISSDGMFIATPQPHPPGSHFEFDFRLGEDFSLLRGEAEVIWQRAGETDGPPGMAVRFVELEDTSRRVIDRMIEQRAEEGLEPFSLEEAAADSGEATEHAAADREALDEPAVAPPPPLAAQMEPETPLRHVAARPHDTEPLAPLEVPPPPEYPAPADEPPPSEAAAASAEEAGAARVAAELAAVEERLAVAESARRELEQRLQEVEAALGGSAEEVRRARARAARLESEGERREAELERATSSAQEAATELAEARAQLDAAREARAALERRLSQVEGERAEIEGRACAAESELDEVRGRVEGLERALERTGSAETRLRVRLEEAETERRRLTAEREAGGAAPSPEAAAAQDELAAGAAVTETRPPAPAARLGWGAVAVAVVAGLALGAAGIAWWSVRGKAGLAAGAGSAASPAVSASAGEPDAAAGTVDEEPARLPADAPIQPLTSAPAAKPAGRTAAVAAPQVTAGEPEPAAGGLAAEIGTAIANWAAAWSARDAERYIDAYASSFTPGDGASREDWAAQRRERLRAPAWITVGIEGLEIEELGDGRARATFTQRYASPTFGDTVVKVLELVRQDGGWKIAAESTPSG